MGQNRRYDMLSGDVARMQDRMKRRPTVVGLTDDQVRTSGRRRDAGAALPVSAWILLRVSYDDPRLVDAEAIAWTDSAVLVRWTFPDTQQPLETWVWASAVRRR